MRERERERERERIFLVYILKKGEKKQTYNNYINKLERERERERN